MSERGQQALQEVREGLGGPPRGLGEVGRPTQRSASGRNAILEFREGTGGPSKGLDGI